MDDLRADKNHEYLKGFFSLSLNEFQNCVEKKPSTIGKFMDHKCNNSNNGTLVIMEH